MAVRVAVARYGKTLSTRGRAKQVLEEAEATIGRRPDPVVVDLKGVLVFSHSFGDEFLGQLVARLRKGKYGRGRSILFVGANEFVAETLDRVLEARRLAALLMDESGRLRLVGAVPRPIQRTFEVVREMETATTAELARRLRVSQQAVNNRLAELLRSGAVDRVEKGEGSGSPYVYRARTDELVGAGTV